MALNPGTKLAVFAIRQRRHSVVWTRAGNGFVNDDGSINVFLDVLPVDGRLHCREAVVELDEAAMVKAVGQGGSQTDLATVQAEGSS